jgi:hypothetical protein
VSGADTAQDADLSHKFPPRYFHFTGFSQAVLLFASSGAGGSRILPWGIYLEVPSARFATLTLARLDSLNLAATDLLYC